MAGEVIRWDPFREALSLRDAMDRLFEDSFVRPHVTRDTARGAVSILPIDMYETADEVIVDAVVLGVKNEDLKVQFADGRLIIEANLPAPKVENATVHYREMTYGQYYREIGLPMDVQADKVEATLHDGILTLRIPKAEEIKPKKIQVKTTTK